MEQWRPVVGYEGRYEVSDQGRVHSLVAPGGPKFLRPGSRKGYKLVRLYRRDASSKTWSVHRLVMNAFVGQMPEGLQTCHNNGDPADNRLSNLRYDTVSENARDRFRHNPGYQKGRVREYIRGERHPRAKFTDAQIEEAIGRVLAGETQAEVGRDMGILKGTLSRWVKYGGRRTDG